MQYSTIVREVAKRVWQIKDVEWIREVKITAPYPSPVYENIRVTVAGNHDMPVDRIVSQLYEMSIHVKSVEVTDVSINIPRPKRKTTS